MSDLHPIDPRLADIERRLSALSPSEARLNVGETLFRAGQASVGQESPSGRWLWPLVTAVSVLTTVVLATSLARRPSERIVYVERPAATTEENPAEPNEVKATQEIVPPPVEPVWLGVAGDPLWSGDSNYIRARQLALRFGVESLPTTRVTAGHDADGRWLRYADWRRGLGQTGLALDDQLPAASGRRPGGPQDARGGS